MTLELFEEWACSKNLPLNFETYCRFVTEFREGELAVMRVECLYMKQLEEQIRFTNGGQPITTVPDAIRTAVNGRPVDVDDVCKHIAEFHPSLEINRSKISKTLSEMWTRGEFNREKSDGSLFRYTQKISIVAVLALVLIGCRTPEFSPPVTQSSLRVNWYADVEWPESAGAKTYFVGYGLHPNTMTNELVTATNRCRINWLELGRTYYFSVRASDGKSYSERTPIVAFKTP